MVLRAPDFKKLKHWEYRLRCTRAFPATGESHSTRYYDDSYEYKNDGKYLSEDFIVGRLRVRQTPGWEHYYIYPPNPQVLCLRRLLKRTPERKVDDA
ncbi:hypothetical protein BgAZ_502460 [Babesia gibsoni]|uniref:Cyclin-dependent kinases regulatory subunit n=1 Tax=Babesia gibsoni TaxID=33632 RepID=A0AAD8LGS7_BABGI|nr:hypothetical protein BgAZ_502460 [Babesia gibsoni]